MNARSSIRDVAVGLIVITAIAGLLALLGMASDGPGFLARQKTVDVIFHDGQGIRMGSPVRVAGLDTGNVVDLDLVKVEGRLCARVRISLPARLLEKLPQDVKVSISPGLTGMSHVDIVAAGESSVALVPGQTIRGVESSFFDPIIEQVGLGPIERSNLGHIIGEVRQTVDTIGPRIRQILTAFQETSGNLKDMGDAVRPAVESTVTHIEDSRGESPPARPRSRPPWHGSMSSRARPKKLSGKTARTSGLAWARFATSPARSTTWW